MQNVRESLLQFATSDGVELEGRLLQLGRFSAIFNVFSPENLLQTSGVLNELKIVTNGHVLYQGRATISGLVGIAGGVTCEVVLEPLGLHVPPISTTASASYEMFQREWLTSYKIRPEFKVVVADVEIFLSNLRQWLDDMALSLQANHNGNAAEQERDLMEQISPRLVASFNSVHERFEDIASKIDPEFRAVHQDFARRRLHPLFLCSPFGYRTYAKPLGYAGDYEMMNMIMRNTYEGNSLFARAVHYWLVNQWPAKSVRNRITHLTENILNEVARVVRSGRSARILNLGCGPAWEVQEFFRTSGLSHEADFTLMDFSAETLSYTGQKLADIARNRGLRARVEMRHASVQQLLRSALQGKSVVENDRFDLIYCAGLFDYLSDATCKAIVNLFYSWLQPGGLILVANMNDTKPFRYMVEFLLDWHLIYRDSRFMMTLIPNTPGASGTVIAEPTTVNLFTHVRKAAAP
ncbi:MAG TPA: class I SAM-dependent methyltransferase [Candidatus Limnocylindria bacterium]|nr:class I SAM-dependent methyltransferase [Candidatus Limnocylindria bacterium]